MPFDGFLPWTPDPDSDVIPRSAPYAERIGAQKLRLEKTPEEKRGAFFFSQQRAGEPRENVLLYGGSAPERAVLFYAHNNQIGAPQKMTNSSMTIVFDREQEPFGEDYATPTNTTPTQHRFPGQYADAEDLLSQNNNREYDPTIGYIEADPIGLAGGLNPRAYAANTPTQAIDPWGLDTLTSYRDPSLQQSWKSNNPQGYYSISMHAAVDSAGQFLGLEDAFGNIYSPQQLANYLKNPDSKSGYVAGQPVLLDSCLAGDSNNGYAAGLANELDASVVGPNQEIRPYQSPYGLFGMNPVGDTEGPPQFTTQLRDGTILAPIPGDWNLYNPSVSGHTVTSYPPQAQ